MSDEPVEKVPSMDVRAASSSNSSEHSKKNDNGIVLIPQPSDDPEDPLVSVLSTLLCAPIVYPI